MDKSKQEEVEICKNCNGYGVVLRNIWNKGKAVKCNECLGRGYIYENDNN